MSGFFNPADISLANFSVSSGRWPKLPFTFRFWTGIAIKRFEATGIFWIVCVAAFFPAFMFLMQQKHRYAQSIGTRFMWRPVGTFCSFHSFCLTKALKLCTVCPWCEASFPPSDRITGASIVSVTVSANHLEPRFATHLQKHTHSTCAKLPGASQRGLMESLNVSSVDPTCLCTLLVIVPLFKKWLSSLQRHRKPPHLQCAAFIM